MAGRQRRVVWTNQAQRMLDAAGASVAQLGTAGVGQTEDDLVVTLTRVVVVGTSCSGKTTFARRLASILDTPCVELDSLYWGPEWARRPNFQQDVLAAVQQPRWIIDGNYSAVRDVIWRRCTAIVWLNYSFARVFSRAVRRTMRRIVNGQRLYGGNRETIGSALFDVEAPLWLVVLTHGKRRRAFRELFRRAEYRHATVIQFRAPAAAELFLAETSVCAERDSPGHPERAGAD